ncbi:replicative DNA helicase [Streptomyces sp. CC53]|uniref:DnaB-like helicase N-terminal domain-containing protein n=1 Tax=unclassified Streptomyces TaxID=2593676 RepID=UPI0008DE6EFA|nr:MULTISPECIES: DnaB-like helicase N-terminal domain-containing protein [unclassified Streptomyces]OII62123.1 replicative DNA helicase [Streptomyces sp. CC53]
MPRTPDHDDETPYEPAQRPPIHYAEQALLGAILLNPTLLADLAGLDPAAFDNPFHAAVFAAMCTVPALEGLTTHSGLDWLNAVLATAQSSTPGLTASFMHTLVSACPRPDHASAYAAIIRSEHARRTVRLHAERLAQAAADTTVPDRPGHALAAADALAQHLDELACRFPSHSASLPRTPPPPPAPPADREEALEAEQLLLANAVSWPAYVKEMRWLTADDFLHPAHAGLWQCVTALVHRGDPVDPVTILWEAQHRGVLAAGVTPADTLALLSTPAGSPEYWGERLVERTLLGRARHVAVRVTAYTDDPANSVHQLVTGSRRALADLHSVRSRWQRATRPPAPPTAKAETTAASRAGPRSLPTTPVASARVVPARPTAGRAP